MTDRWDEQARDLVRLICWNKGQAPDVAAALRAAHAAGMAEEREAIAERIGQTVVILGTEGQRLLDELAEWIETREEEER